MNLVEGLGREIARCTELLGHYESLRGKPQISPLTFLITVPMIEKDLEEAKLALGSNDVVRMMRAYKVLEEMK